MIWQISHFFQKQKRENQYHNIIRGVNHWYLVDCVWYCNITQYHEISHEESALWFL